MGSSYSSSRAEKILDDLTLESVADYIKSGKCQNIITMIGAGMSTAAGIPDFRSPGSGLYDNLGKYNLPFPQAMFEIHYFKVGYFNSFLLWFQKCMGFKNFRSLDQFIDTDEPAHEHEIIIMLKNNWSHASRKKKQFFLVGAS